MRIRPVHLISSLLLAIGLVSAKSSEEGFSGPGLSNPDRREISGTGGKNLGEDARQKFESTKRNAEEIQRKFQLQNIPQAEPVLKKLLSLLTQAHDALTAANYPLVFSLCTQADFQVGVLHNLGSESLAGQRWDPLANPSHEGEGQDTARIREQLKAHALWDLQRTSERFNLLAQRLQESKATHASDLIEKAKTILVNVKQEIGLEHFSTIRPMLDQVEAFFPELSRLAEQTSDLEKHGLSGSFQDSYKNRQPSAQVGQNQASEVYNRVLERVSRIRDQHHVNEDPKSAALLIRVQELVEKCRESLIAGQGDAAKVLGLKAEALLTEWHQNKEKGNGQTPALSSTSIEHLKMKFEKAQDIIKKSGNEKAARILEKGLEHFQRAEQNQTEGQSAHAQVEMDIALKLAAKAVDIARSGKL